MGKNTLIIKTEQKCSYHSLFIKIMKTNQKRREFIKNSTCAGIGYCFLITCSTYLI